MKISAIWREQSVPITDLLTLDRAITACPSIEWRERPKLLLSLEDNIDEFSQANNRLAELLEEAEGLGISRDSIPSLLDAEEVIERAVRTAIEQSDRAQDLEASVASELERIESLVAERSKLLRRMISKLPGSLKLKVDIGSVTMKRRLGCYQYRYRDNPYEGQYTDTSWVDKLSEAYHNATGGLEVGSDDKMGSRIETIKEQVREMERIARESQDQAAEAERLGRIKKNAKKQGFSFKKRKLDSGSTRIVMIRTTR